MDADMPQILTQVREDLRTLSSRTAKLEGLGAQMEGIKTQLQGFETRVSVRLASLEAKVGTELATKKELADFRAANERLLVAALDAQEKARTAADKALSHPDILNDHGTRLRDHERRLRKLEGRESGTT